jgi:methylated-DNA-[protein]-cysteine S-methyltransferase
MFPPSHGARVHTKIRSPLGDLTLVRQDERLAGLYFRHHWYRPREADFGPRVDHGFDLIVAQLGEYFAGARQRFDVPTVLHGSPLQVAAWRLVAGIPYGHTTTYGTLARELDSEITPKDFGALVGRNPLCIVVPCHRIIGARGNLTGYAGGLNRKQALLQLEKAAIGPSAAGTADRCLP